MRDKIDEKRKVTSEEKAVILPILKKYTVGYLASTAGLSRTTVSEVKNHGLATHKTIDKLSKAALEIEKSQNN